MPEAFRLIVLSLFERGRQEHEAVEAAKEKGVSESDFYRAMHEHLEAGLVVVKTHKQTGEHGIFLTSKGRDALDEVSVNA